MTRLRRRPGLIAVVALMIHGGCAPRDDSSRDAGTEAGSGSADDTGAVGSADGFVAQDTALRSAAGRVVAFLRGAAAYETLNLADTVTLILPAEGGDTRRPASRDQLREPADWTVEGNGQRYSLVPPPEATRMRLAPGRHFNCLEGSLADRIPDLATVPHVGVRLDPPSFETCLQGWNATFVFDTAGGAPRLTAAVYDQWEW